MAAGARGRFGRQGWADTPLLRSSSRPFASLLPARKAPFPVTASIQRPPLWPRRTAPVDAPRGPPAGAPRSILEYRHTMLPYACRTVGLGKWQKDSQGLGTPLERTTYKKTLPFGVFCRGVDNLKTHGLVNRGGQTGWGSGLTQPSNKALCAGVRLPGKEGSGLGTQIPLQAGVQTMAHRPGRAKV